MKKWQGYQYIEFREFETLKDLLESRFVKGLRRKELFSDLGLEPVSFKHKHRKKRPYNRRQPKVKPVNLDEYESREFKPYPHFQID